MFSQQERALIRKELLERAAGDKRLSGAAITGSGAVDNEDRWSDIDLAFGVTSGSRVEDVVADWTLYMMKHLRALHHFDLRSGSWLYRVFLLPGTLQVDLAFVNEAEFRALTPTFRLVSGKAEEAQHVQPPSTDNIIGLGWLYALHARSCIAREKFWQAEFMISAVRDTALTLAAIRHGLPAAYGRGFDRLPPDVTEPFSKALVRRLNSVELRRAFGIALSGLQSEIRRANAELAKHLQETISTLAESLE